MYDVVLLIERAISKSDAVQVTGLHDSVDEKVRSHVIHPREDAASRIETALGSIAASEVLATSAMSYPEMDIDELQREIRGEAQKELDTSLHFLKATGHDAVGDVSSQDPVLALSGAVEAHN